MRHLGADVDCPAAAAQRIEILGERLPLPSDPFAQRRPEGARRGSRERPLIGERRGAGAVAADLDQRAVHPGAQPPAILVIGFLSTRSPEDIPHLLSAFLRGLAENGYVEGQNVTIEYRWALGQYDRLPALAAELAGRPVVVIVAAGGEPAAMAAKATTSTIPIAFVIGGDPVTVGLAASYNRPGGNATGISIMTSTLDPKRLRPVA